MLGRKIMDIDNNSLLEKKAFVCFIYIKEELKVEKNKKHDLTFSWLSSH